MSVTTKIDWTAYMHQHDLLWDRLPKAWDEGPFLGNGLLGASLYWDGGAQALRLDVNAVHVQDHRTPIQHQGICNSRLPIGHFNLKTRSNVSDAVFRLDLYNATATGTLTTLDGTITLKVYVHATDDVIVVESSSTGEEMSDFEFIPEEAFALRQSYGISTKSDARRLKGYKPNPKGLLTEGLWVQPLLAGGGTATAWDKQGDRLQISIAFDRKDIPMDQARNRAFTPVDYTAHTKHWNAFYPASFVSFPDARLESFYWIQLYKIASAARPDGPYVDNNGPWLQATPWSYSTWNLNVQLIYWIAIASNHSDLVLSLMNSIHNNRQNLIDNCEEPYKFDSATMLRNAGSDLVSPAHSPRADGDLGEVDGLQSGLSQGLSKGVVMTTPPEVGNLPWALHDCWLMYKHTMDDELLKEKLFPILRLTTNYYLHFLVDGADGKIHLLPTYSPEYGSAEDLNYNLALIRWSCEALLESCKRLGIKDELESKWQSVLDNLVDYPVDAQQGWLIGKDFPMNSSHRHYSHMLQAYPLYLVNRDQGTEAQDVIKRTLDHWQSMPEMLRGYSNTGGSSIASALKRGDDSLRFLRGLFDDFVRPNTMYKEDGPVIETPLSAAQSVLDMLLQSWGNAIRPFPSVPSEWPMAVFSGLTAEGGFSVSAKWANSRTEFIVIESMAGERVSVETDIVNPEVTVNGNSVATTVDWRGFVTFDLAKGDIAVLCVKGEKPDLVIEPISQDQSKINSWGQNSHSVPGGNRESRINWWRLSAVGPSSHVDE